MLAPGGARAALALASVNTSTAARVFSVRTRETLFFTEPDFVQPDGYDSEEEMLAAFEANRPVDYESEDEDNLPTLIDAEPEANWTSDVPVSDVHACSVDRSLIWRILLVGLALGVAAAMHAAYIKMHAGYRPLRRGHLTLLTQMHGGTLHARNLLLQQPTFVSASAKSSPHLGNHTLLNGTMKRGLLPGLSHSATGGDNIKTLSDMYTPVQHKGTSSNMANQLEYAQDTPTTGMNNLDDVILIDLVAAATFASVILGARENLANGFIQGKIEPGLDLANGFIQGKIEPLYFTHPYIESPKICNRNATSLRLRGGTETETSPSTTQHQRSPPQILELLSRAQEASRSNLSDIDIERTLRPLLTSLGASRVERSSLHAMRAIVNQLEFPHRFPRDSDYWTETGASGSNFRTWRRKLRAEMLRASSSPTATDHAADAMVALATSQPVGASVSSASLPTSQAPAEIPNYREATPEDYADAIWG